MYSRKTHHTPEKHTPTHTHTHTQTLSHTHTHTTHWYESLHCVENAVPDIAW